MGCTTHVTFPKQLIPCGHKVMEKPRFGEQSLSSLFCSMEQFLALRIKIIGIMGPWMVGLSSCFSTPLVWIHSFSWLLCKGHGSIGPVDERLDSWCWLAHHGHHGWLWSQGQLLFPTDTPTSWHFLSHLLQNLLQWWTQDGFGSRSSVFRDVWISARDRDTPGSTDGNTPLALPLSPCLVLKRKEPLGGLVPGHGPLLGVVWLGACCMPGLDTSRVPFARRFRVVCKY